MGSAALKEALFRSSGSFKTGADVPRAEPPDPRAARPGPEVARPPAGTPPGSSARSPDWTVKAGPPTLLVHGPTSTRLALPAAGPWGFNPAEPRYLACDALHIELRAR